MASRINLNERVLEQLQRQDIREILNLPLEQSQAKSSLEELLKAAQAAIRGELADTGYDEDELLHLRLEYTLASKESEKPEEIYSVEWYQSSQEIDSNKLELATTVIEDEVVNSSEDKLDNSEKLSNSQLPVAIAFLGRLAQRFDEAIADVVPESTGSRLFWSFRSFPKIPLGSCLCQNEHDGLMYEGNKLADGTCSGSGPCGSRTDIPR